MHTYTFKADDRKELLGHVLGESARMQSLTQRLLQGQNLRTNAWLKKDSNERINKRTKHLTTERTNERNNELTHCDTRILPTDRQTTMCENLGACHFTV